MTSSRRPALLVLVVAALLGDAARAAAQSCAMCGSVLGNDPLGKAFSWSILFLMAAPYTIVGSVGLWFFFTYRRASRRRAALTTSGSTPEHQGDFS
jgi:hypothetical protein